MKIKNLTVAGSGVLGTQIAFQSAFHNINVVLYDVGNDILDNGKKKLIGLQQTYMEEIAASRDAVDLAFSRISYSSDLSEAVRDADLIIEAIPENVEIKKGFYKQLSEVAPAKTIFAGNSSTMLPSTFAAFTGRPERFLNLHFSNEIWVRNSAELMGHPGTSHDALQAVAQFAKDIGMVVVTLKKEQPGYILNSLLIPLLLSALELLVNEVASVEDIDAGWKIGTGSPLGPFQILDRIGANTAHNIVTNIADQTGDPHKRKIADYIKANFLDKGKMGRVSGEGFYKY